MNGEGITILDADLRMTKCRFAESKDGPSFPRTVYTCPICSEQRSFSLEDFNSRALSEMTNLTRDDANDIGVASQAYSIKVHQNVNFRSFIDFYCGGCRSAVRIYYDSWGGGRFTYGHELAFVVEKSSKLVEGDLMTGGLK